MKQPLRTLLLGLLVAAGLWVQPAANGTTGTVGSATTRIPNGWYTQCRLVLDEARACVQLRVNGSMYAGSYIVDEEGGRNVKVAVENLRLREFAWIGERWKLVDERAVKDRDGFFDKGEGARTGLLAQHRCRRYKIIADFGFRHNGVATFAFNKLMMQKRNPC